MRVLVIGASATIEETHRTGNPDARPFPTVRNFCSYWGQIGLAPGPTIAAAMYLDSCGIQYNRTVLEFFLGLRRELRDDDGNDGPLQVLQKTAESNPSVHNVESVYEFVWNHRGVRDEQFWSSFVEQTVYLPIFDLQHQHFFQNGVGWKRLEAGQRVAKLLRHTDQVISLNYDTVFEIAMKQVQAGFRYSPNLDEGEISVYKPHGSLNLYVNTARKMMKFIEPDVLPGTFNYPDENGTWHPAQGIIPPRLNKDYAQHPISQIIVHGDLLGDRPDDQRPRFGTNIRGGLYHGRTGRIHQSGFRCLRESREVSEKACSMVSVAG